jgi:hypothetical protein
VQFSYDAASRRARLTFPNGFVDAAEKEYDCWIAARPTEVGSPSGVNTASAEYRFAIKAASFAL